MFKKLIVFNFLFIVSFKESLQMIINIKIVQGNFNKKFAYVL